MRGFQPKKHAGGAMPHHAKAAGHADGGVVRGPGTGTSDDVPDEVRKGTYIMPADSTEALGTDQLAAMGARGFQGGGKVPVNLSAGEFKLPPEQVHAVGVQALDAMRAATHTPVRGFAPQAAASPDEPRQFFANGGAVGVLDDEQKRLSSPDNTFPGNRLQGESGSSGAPVGAANAPKPAPAVPEQPRGFSFQDNNQAVGQDIKDTWNKGNYGEAVGKTVAGTVGMFTTPAIVGAGHVLDGVRGFGAGLFGSDASAAPVPATTPASAPAAQKPTGAAPPSPVPSSSGGAPTAATATPPGDATASTVPPPGTKPATTDGTQVMPGVYQHGRGQYSGSASGMEVPRGFTGQPNAENQVLADTLAARSVASAGGASAPVGFQPQAIMAPTVRHSGNDWQARKDLANAQTAAASIMANGGRWDRHKGVSPERMAYDAALKADAVARGFEPAMDMEAMRQNGALQREGLQQAGTLQREQVHQAGANQRAALGFQVDSRRADTESKRVGSEIEARGFQTRAAAQQEQLRGVLMDPNATTQQKAQAQATLQALNGKGDHWKAVALQGGTDAMGNKTESILGAVNERTGEMKRMDQGGVQKQPQFEKGGVYVDGQGRRARYTGSGWEPA